MSLRTRLERLARLERASFRPETVILKLVSVHPGEPELPLDELERPPLMDGETWHRVLFRKGNRLFDPAVEYGWEKWKPRNP